MFQIIPVIAQIEAQLQECKLYIQNNKLGNTENQESSQEDQ